MDKKEIENLILKFLYDCWERRTLGSLSDLINQTPNVDSKVFEKVMERMEREGLLNLQSGYFSEIQAKGVITAEKRQLISKEKVVLNGKVRYKIIELAVNADDGNADEDYVNSFEMKIDVDFGHSGIDQNLELLSDLGLITMLTIAYYKITDLGRDHYEEWKIHESIGNEYERIKKLSAQIRGKELEKLFAKIVDFAGWQSDLDVKTKYEQMDVVVHKIREYYLVECKWEKNPIEAHVINELIGKLTKRVLTNGILVSMSGFTSGAVTNAEESTAVKTVLLFGKNDLENLISDPSSFEQILDEKYNSLISKRKVIFE